MSKYLASYALLLALRKNIDEMNFETKESYVNQFHKALNDIEQEAGPEMFRANDFAVEAQYLRPTITSFNSRTQQSTYSHDKYCETRLFLTKVDAALNYLLLIAPKEDKQRMGF